LWTWDSDEVLPFRCVEPTATEARRGSGIGAANERDRDFALRRVEMDHRNSRH